MVKFKSKSLMRLLQEFLNALQNKIFLRKLLNVFF